MLLHDIEEMLSDNGFAYCEYGGCFDIAARRESLFLVKVLGNIDSFQEEQASNLKILSRELEAKPVLVGLHTRRETLSNNIIYDRFDVPALTPKTFENILNGLFPEICRMRGGLFVEIDSEALREARKSAQMSQSELAGKVGITKKSVYEHESKKMKIVYKHALKLEKVLKVSMILPLDISADCHAEADPRSVFEVKISRNFRKMGFETGSVYQSPFNMIIKEKGFVLLSGVEEVSKRIEKKIPYISEFSKLAGKSAVIITKEEANFSIPTIVESELGSMRGKDVKRIIKNW